MKRFRDLKLFPRTFCFLLLLFTAVILLTNLAISGVLLWDVYRDLDSRLDRLTAAIGEAELAECGDILDACAQNAGIDITAQWNGERYTFREDPLVVEETGRALRNVASVTIQNGEAVTRDGVEVHLELGVSSRAVLMPFPVITLAALLLSALFAYLYSRTITRPIQRMLRGTRDMEKLDRDARICMDTEDELGTLARQINQLYDRLWGTIHSLELEKARMAELERAKVDFLRAASHELKTPLAGLRILLENMRYDVGKYKDHATYLREGIGMVDRLNAMVCGLLEASGGRGDGGNVSSAAEEMASVWRDYELLAMDRELTMDVEIPPDLAVEMDRALFRRVWSNLLSNAVRYTDRGGHIAIRGGEGELSVWNACAPLTREQAERAFEAFYRPDPARSGEDGGSGLGLYLVRELLTASRLDCAFVPEGRGMRFTMALAPREELS